MFRGTWFFRFYSGPVGTGGKGRRGWIRRVLGGMGRVSWGTIVTSPDEGRSTSSAAGSGSLFSRSSDLGFVWATASTFLANIPADGKIIALMKFLAEAKTPDTLMVESDVVPLS